MTSLAGPGRPSATGLLAIGGAALVSIAVGAAVPHSTTTAFAVLVLVLAVAAIAAPSALWVVGALIAALTFRGLVTLGLLPSIAAFVDIPLAWGALAVALLRRRELAPVAPRLTLLLAGVAAAVVVSWLMHPSELLRPVAYLLLLGQPFALLVALAVDPPTPKLRRLLVGVTVALLAVQIPTAWWQAASLGIRDTVQGTLYGAGAGAHVISGVAAVGALWIWSIRWGPLLPRVALITGLLSIPFLADAKQVILALPVVVLVGLASRDRARWLLPGAVAIAAVVALFQYHPDAPAAARFLEQTQTGVGGKAAAADLVWNEVTTDPESVLFGKGPAETVSRAAFMTTDLLLRPDSSLRRLELHPARIAADADARAINVSGGGTSFNSGISSAVGVVGDLGLVGAAVYLALLVSIIGALRRSDSPAATGLMGGWGIFAVLGVVFDWWEQPPFTLILATLTGLALTAGREPGPAPPARPSPASDR